MHGWRQCIDNENQCLMESLKNLTKKLTEEISGRLSNSGMMFRIFSRVKTIDSTIRKLEVKYAKRKATSKVQDIIGIRIVVYFQDDVDVLALYFGQADVVKRAIDEYDVSTFRPQRLNLTCRLPEQMIEEFRAALPKEFAEHIDDTYEIQIRTVFSEGWHEVEHDLRYKCKEDWEGCESYSRTLNGIIASLETAEWNMMALFNDMARRNLQQRNFTAMLRNKMHIRISGKGLSEELNNFLNENEADARAILDTDRLIVIHTLLAHDAEIKLSYDILLFIINRIEIMNPKLMALESPEIRVKINEFLQS